ncbi:MAG: ABC transporter permease [Gammaproteobacteria bacterium]|nr:ABC transporter permease [Gammaproteobacteria bacterium]
MHAALTVFLKEVRENLRDRRTLVNALLTGPLLAPVMFVVLINAQLHVELGKAEKPLSVPVVGAANAPNLVAALRRMGMVVKPAPRDPEAAVRSQKADVVLRIPAGYGAHWRKGETAQVELIYDSSHRDTQAQIARLRDMVDGYAKVTGAQRLLARGLSPALASPLVAANRDQATPQARGALIFSMLPYFFVLTAFLGGMYLAIDTTAGERERQSLEPLFATPVARRDILIGKLGATTAFALASLALSITAFAVAGRFVDTSRLDMVLSLGAHFAVFVMLLMLPLVVLLAALQTLVAAFARSYREAQTYLSLLMLVPLLPSVLLIVVPVKARLWMYAVPLLGQQVGIMQLERGDALGALPVAACLAGTALAALLAILVTMRVYASERLAISG